MKVLKSILLIFCIYIYLYNPIFRSLGFGSIKLLLLVSAIYLIFKGFKFIGMFKIEIFFTSILIIYSLLTVFWGDNSGFTTSYRHLIWFLECFIIPTFLLLLFKDVFKKLSWEFIIVVSGFIASLITLFLIFNPSINLFIRNSVIFDTLDTVSVGEFDFRGFTIAEGSTFGYGVIQGLVLAICIFSIRISKMYIIPIIFLFISIIFNARVGITPVAISLFLVIFSGRLKIGNLILILVIIIWGYWFLLFSDFAIQNETSLAWGLGIFSDTKNLASGKDFNSNYVILFDYMIFFPSDIVGLLFGEGKDIFNTFNSKINNSDIGYILQIFRGGLFYLIFMLFFLWKMFKKNMKNSSNKLIPILFFLTLLIVNIKGDAFFVSNGFFRLFSFYYIYSIFTKYNIIYS